MELNLHDDNMVIRGEISTEDDWSGDAKIEWMGRTVIMPAIIIQRIVNHTKTETIKMVVENIRDMRPYDGNDGFCSACGTELPE